jgi:putative endonuclease
MESDKEFCVYILENEKHRYYVRYTDDLDKRLDEHNRGESLATRGRGPWKVAYYETYFRKSEALRRERQIKRMKSRGYIESLIQQGEDKHIGA